MGSERHFLVFERAVNLDLALVYFVEGRVAVVERRVGVPYILRCHLRTFVASFNSIRIASIGPCILEVTANSRLREQRLRRQVVIWLVCSRVPRFLRNISPCDRLNI